jgi:hypothetical protein
MQLFGADRHARDGRSDCCPKASTSPLHPLRGQSLGGRLGVAADVGFGAHPIDHVWVVQLEGRPHSPLAEAGVTCESALSTRCDWSEHYPTCLTLDEQRHGEYDDSDCGQQCARGGGCGVAVAARQLRITAPHQKQSVSYVHYADLSVVTTATSRSSIRRCECSPLSDRPSDCGHPIVVCCRGQCAAHHSGMSCPYSDFGRGPK